MLQEYGVAAPPEFPGSLLTERVCLTCGGAMEYDPDGEQYTCLHCARWVPLDENFSVWVPSGHHQKRGRGRPKGSRDSYQRVRRA